MINIISVSQYNGLIESLRSNKNDFDIVIPVNVCGYRGNTHNFINPTSPVYFSSLNQAILYVRDELNTPSIREVCINQPVRCILFDATDNSKIFLSKVINTAFYDILGSFGYNEHISSNMHESYMRNPNEFIAVATNFIANIEGFKKMAQKWNILRILVDFRFRLSTNTGILNILNTLYSNYGLSSEEYTAEDFQQMMSDREPHILSNTVIDKIMNKLFKLIIGNKYHGYVIYKSNFADEICIFDPSFVDMSDNIAHTILAGKLGGIKTRIKKSVRRRNSTRKSKQNKSKKRYSFRKTNK